VIGIKVWIFKGEVFDLVPEVVEESAADAAAPADAAQTAA
jgi:ribosomal protein S3